MILRNIKNLIQKLVHFFGYKVEKLSYLNCPELLICHLLEKNQVTLLLDVGANSGQFASGVLDLGFSGQVISFEPLNTPWNILKEKSTVYPNWTVAPKMALGETKKTVQINVSDNLVSSSLMSILPRHVQAAPQSQVSKIETVSMNTLDDFFDENQMQDLDFFLKIDVQGYEHQVLNGFSSNLKRAKWVLLEVSFVPLYEGQVLFDDTLRRMKDIGYQVIAIYPNFSDPNGGKILQADCIFERICSSNK